MVNKVDDPNEAMIKELFKRADYEELKASPYLATRVLAEIDSRSKARHLRFWKAFGLANALAVAVLVLMVAFKPSQATFKAASGEDMLVQVELTSLKKLKIARAEIVLPDGVEFYSNEFPELSSERSLEVAFEENFTAENLPFVIKSNSNGTREIKIHFYGSSGEIVAEKSLKIEFRDS